MAILDNYLRIKAGELTPKQEKRLKAFLTFSPKEGTEVWCYRPRASGGLWVPRGALDYVKELAPDIRIQDRRSFPKLPKWEPNIVLDYKDADKEFVGQADCVRDMRIMQQGSIHRQPGTGKTQIALYFCGTIGTRSLVLVHTEDILQQWMDYANAALPEMSIGVIRGKREEIGDITIATIQTMFKRDYPPEFWRLFGCTVLDECHHGPAKTFDRVISHVTSRYLFGFSASKTRADNMQPLVRYNFGPVIQSIKFSAPMPVTVEKIKTNFRAGKPITGPLWLRRKRWHGMIGRMVKDPKRNALIGKWVAEKLDEGRSTLVLSRRIEHLQLIQIELEKRGHHSVILAAGLLPKPERRKMVAAFKAGEIKCVLATQLADEALDVPILSAVALAYPGKHTDLILQQIGRSLREFKGKTDAVIGDFCDAHVKVLNSHWHGRRRFYLQSGFKIKGAGLRGRLGGSKRRIRKAVTGRIR